VDFSTGGIPFRFSAVYTTPAGGGGNP